MHEGLTIARGIAVVFAQPAGAARPVFAREQATAQRRIGRDKDAKVIRHRQDLDLGLAFDQIVHRLDHRDIEAETRRDPSRLDHLPGGKVGQTDVADMALLLQLRQCAKAFRQGVSASNRCR